MPCTTMLRSPQPTTTATMSTTVVGINILSICNNYHTNRLAMRPTKTSQTRRRKRRRKKKRISCLHKVLLLLLPLRHPLVAHLLRQAAVESSTPPQPQRHTTLRFQQHVPDLCRPLLIIPTYLSTHSHIISTTYLSSAFSHHIITAFGRP